MATKDLLRHCPICLNHSGEILHRQRFAVPPHYCLAGAYDVVACPRCGFVFADTPSRQEDYDRYYAECSKYEDPDLASGGGVTEWDARRLERTATDIARVIPGKDASIIDIGCANGGLLAALVRKGCKNVTGLDPSRACVAHVAARGIRAVAGGLSSDDPPGSPLSGVRFDCVIACHILEHVCDLGRAAANLLRRLKAGGILYVEVPDASRYRAFPVVPFYYFDCEHINHFDECSLRNLFLPFGCEIVEAGRKELPVSEAGVYPAVYTVFRATGRPGRHQTMTPDFAARESVAEHVRRSREDDPGRQLNEFIRTGEKIIVWGAGSYALRLLEDSSLGKCDIAAFVDTDAKKHGTTLKNIPVCSPERILEHEGPVVVCAALHGKDILAAMKRMGLKNRTVVL